MDMKRFIKHIGVGIVMVMLVIAILFLVSTLRKEEADPIGNAVSENSN